MQLRALIEEHRPLCLVVDPISAMLKAGGLLEAGGVAQRLLHTTKAGGITTVCTSLLPGLALDEEATELQVSTLADTWMPTRLPASCLAWPR